VRVYELLGEAPLPAARAGEVERFATALAHYRAGRLAAARELFEQLLAERPGDRPSALYAERCRRQLAPAAAPQQPA
jgi:hypothetical protein